MNRLRIPAVAFVFAILLVVTAVETGRGSEQLARIGTFPEPGLSFEIRENLMYVGTYGGLEVVGIGNPASPRIERVFWTDGNVNDVLIHGTTLYAAEGDLNLFIFDISNPPDLVQISNTSLSGSFRTDLYGFDRFGDYLFMSVEINYARGEIAIVDISDLGNPSLVSSIAFGSVVPDCRYRDGYLYVLAGSSGLRILDVSDPLSPVEVGSYDTGGKPWEIEFDGEFAYVADREKGLQILDITDPINPIDTGHGFDNTSAYSIALAQDRLYLGDETGLRVYRRNATGEVEFLDSFPSGWEINEIEHHGSRIYTIDGGISIYEFVRSVEPTDYTWIGVAILIIICATVALSILRGRRSKGK